MKKQSKQARHSRIKTNDRSKNNGTSRVVKQYSSQVPALDLASDNPSQGEIQGHSAYSRITVKQKVNGNTWSVIPYAVAHFKVDFEDIVCQVWNSDPIFKNKLDVVINEYAKSYFTTVSPALITSIRDQIEIILDRSARAYAIATTAIRCFNAYNSKDAFGRSISFIASTYEDFSDIGDPNHIRYAGPWDFNHNNEIGLNDYTVSAMRRDFVGPLCGLAFLSPTLKETIRGMFSGVILQSRGDNDCARYITFYPEFSQNDVSLNHMKTELTSQLTEIRTAVAEYPFITNILTGIGLELINSPDFYDIDQTQNTLNVFVDSSNVVRDSLDHFVRSDYALSDLGDINDLQFVVEDNTFLSDQPVFGPGAMIPLFTNVNYVNFMTMAMGQVSLLNVQIARLYNEPGAGNDATVVAQINAINGHQLIFAPTNTDPNHDIAYRITLANTLLDIADVVDLDEIWNVKVASTTSGFAYGGSEYMVSLGSYFIPREYNSLTREVAMAAFFTPKLTEYAASEHSKQDVVA